MSEYLFRLGIDKIFFTSRSHDTNGAGGWSQEVCEFDLRSLVSGNVADGAHRECAFLGFQRAQADLHGKFGAVLAQTVKLQASPHGPCAGFREKTRALVGMRPAKTLGDEKFHLLPHPFVPPITQHLFRLSIY